MTGNTQGNPRNAIPVYETRQGIAVAASQTDANLSPSGPGSVGDYVSHVLITPLSTSPGAVTLSDGATDYPLFAGGASSVPSLIPFPAPLGMFSQEAGWTITTGAAVQVIAIGNFVSD